MNNTPSSSVPLPAEVKRQIANYKVHLEQSGRLKEGDIQAKIAMIQKAVTNSLTQFANAYGSMGGAEKRAAYLRDIGLRICSKFLLPMPPVSSGHQHRFGSIRHARAA